MKAQARKAVIKTMPHVKQASLNDLKGKAHFHFCQDRECRLIYECNCENVYENGPCSLCRVGYRASWMTTRDPQECCLDNCEQVLLPADLIRYELAGPGPWWQCITCRRAHGWNCVT